LEFLEKKVNILQGELENINSLYNKKVNESNLKDQQFAQLEKLKIDWSK
jgi:hypothetical protein